jgi:hypothetical protein
MNFTRILAVTAMLAALAPIQGAIAANTPISIPVSGGIFDMVYDTQRGILYMTTGKANVLRFQMSTQTFLSPIQIAGNLLGIDISADTNSLAIADNSSNDDMVWVDDYNLVAGTLAKITGASGESYVSGTFDPAFDAMGRIAVTATLDGSGAGIPMYIADPATMTLRRVTGNNASDVTEDTVLQASPDHSTVAYTAGDISSGPWGTVNTAKATLDLKQDTNWFTYTIAVANKGKFFAVPTYDGTFVANHKGVDTETIGKYANTYYDGAAFDPKKHSILYQSLANSTTIQAFNIVSGKLLQTYQTGVSIPWDGNGSFGTGYLRIASDGSYLFMKSDAGAVAIPLR